FARREVVFFYLTWPAALYPTPVTARPPAGRAGKGRNFGTRCAGLPKLGDAPRPAPAKLALSGREVCFGRRSRSKHDLIFFPRLRAGKLCEACPTGRVGGAEGVGYPKGGIPTPKAFPLGGRCPSAHTGADEGATDSPNGAGEERRPGDSLILLQGKVGYRIAPSCVTFGDSFPPRGSLRR